MVPRNPRYFRPQPGSEFAAVEPQRGVVAMHLGCVEAELFGDDIKDSITALTREGFKVVCPQQPSCCGAAAAHDGDHESGKSSGELSLGQLKGFDAIIVPAAGCTAFLNDLDESAGVVDPMVFLARVGLRSELKPVDRKVVYSTPCHRTNVLRDTAEMRAALQAIPGLELVESDEAELCCGAGGAAFLKQPDLTDAVGMRKADSITASGAAQVISGNPGCAMQLEAKLRERGSEMDVVHPITLLREALRD